MENLFYFFLAVSIGGALSRDCKGQPDVIYEHSCLTVSRCKSGQDLHYICKHGEAIDNKDDYKCKPIHTVAPPCNRINDCSKKSDGSYPDVSEGCSSYYTCFRHQFVGRNFCPGDLLFHQTKQVCNYKENVTCK
ncbi:chitin-binding domain protein cbd-1-like [Octopus vulgaris]|uniref:Chitin-binding domain protein cbd-1-like n=1 Tax=Octopus vulgaris TaxID=6645 RepID=A0AA36BV88_OCTVU|nr:chitin-binding domain protein cbd-1-like [Octopus vulgaris]